MCVHAERKEEETYRLSGKGPGGLKEFNEALKEDQIQFGGFRVTGVDRKVHARAFDQSLCL